jgi:hypothetical protein
MNLSSTQLRLLGSVMYFAAVALLINFLAQFTITVWPFKFGELNWRVGSTGLFMDVLLSAVIPLTLIQVAAIMNNDRRLLQVARIVILVLGIGTILLLGMFALDSVQILSQLNQNMKATFIKVALRASLVGCMLAILFPWFAISMGKVLKSQGMVRTPGVKDTDKEQMLMVGTRDSRPNLRAIDTADLKKDASRKEGTGGLSVDM